MLQMQSLQYSSFPFDTKSHKYVADLNPQPNHQVFGSSALERRRRGPAKIDMSFKVYGIYLLPDAWKAKIDDPQEQTYTYDIRFGKFQMKGKVIPRQLTEEEKVEAENSKNKKGAAPAKDPKKKGQEDEVSPEEKERLEKEQQQKEEDFKQKQSTWEGLDEHWKFITYAEDPFREPKVKFISDENPGGEPIIEFKFTLEGEDLFQFEQEVTDKKGIYLFFDKLPPVEEEDPKKAGQKAAPKKGAVEEMKPTHGRVWIDLYCLSEPGAVRVQNRQTLETVLKLAEGVDPQQTDYTFENAQTYVHYDLELSESIYPYTYPTYPSQQYQDHVSQLPQTETAPDTIDVISEFQRTIQVIAKDIGVEYNRVFNGEGTHQGSDDKDSPRGTKPGSTVFSTPAQQKEMREQRKEKFLQEFNTSAKYFVLRDKLKKAVLRFVVEKYKREQGNKILTQDEREKFKAELYVYLNEMMVTTVQQAIDSTKDTLHTDIWMQQNVIRDERLARANKLPQESLKEKCLRLYKEFDVINDQENSERWLVHCITKEGLYNFEYFTQLQQFCLKYGMYLRAERYLKLWRNVDTTIEGKIKIQQAALYIQRDNYKDALPMLDEILQNDWKNYEANILMGLLYDKIGRPGLSRKHFAIVKCRKLRELNQLPPKSNQPKNFRTIQEEFKIQAVDFKITKDQQLSYDQSDILYYDFIDMLLEGWIYDLADSTLTYIKDQSTQRYLMTLAKIRVQQRNYSEGVQSLDKVLAEDPKNQAAWILRGHAYFMANNLFDSEESYIKALRIKPTPKDPVLQERLGIVYARRKAWKDARVVFLKNCKEFTSTTSWMYLGLSLLRLGELHLAEDAFTQANILDNLNPKVWGYMTILCLYYGKDRRAQAEMCFKEAIQVGLKDIEILEEIGDLYAKENLLDLATESFKRLVEIDPKHGEGWQKLADVYCSNNQQKQSHNERSLAIESYKKAIELVEGENNKSKIALTLKELLQNEGREEEIEPYRKYLLDDSLTQ
eukprot:403343688